MYSIPDEVATGGRLFLCERLRNYMDIGREKEKGEGNGRGSVPEYRDCVCGLTAPRRSPLSFLSDFLLTAPNNT